MSAPTPPAWMSPGAQDFLMEQPEDDRQAIIDQTDAIRDHSKQTNVRTLKKAMKLLGMDVEYEPNRAGADARSLKARGEVWEAVQVTIKRSGCKCGLTPDMTPMELRRMTGCRDQPPINVGQGGGRYVCPALDTFRRRVGAVTS